jgi:hypothetical protein
MRDQVNEILNRVLTWPPEAQAQAVASLAMIEDQLAALQMLSPEDRDALVRGEQDSICRRVADALLTIADRAASVGVASMSMEEIDAEVKAVRASRQHGAQKMTKDQIQAVLENVRFWPQEDQEELAELAREIEARRKGVYVMDDEERAAVEEALEQARRGEFVSDEEMDAFWKKIGVL